MASDQHDEQRNHVDEERLDRRDMRRKYALAALSGIAQHAAASRANEVDTARSTWAIADAMLETENEDRQQLQRSRQQEQPVGRAYNNRR